MGGYKNFRELLITYAFILGFTALAFFVRLVKFDEFTLDFHVKIFLTSIVLISFFWECLRNIHRWLNRVYPFEKNIAGRIAAQVALGMALGIIVRFLIYRFGEPLVPLKLDSLFLAATWALYLI